MRFEGSGSYVATDDLKLAVNAAITLERPLLVKGEPGGPGARHARTGQMTKAGTLLFVVAALIAHQAAAAAPKPGKYAERPWGAVAYNTTTGQYGYAVDYSTRRAAETEAFRVCGPECDLIKSFRDTCGALASRGSAHVWDTGSSREIAEMKARRKCGAKGCRISVWACTTQK